LTACRPFAAPSVMGIAMEVTQSTPTAPREVRPAIAPGLETIVLQCLAKRPADRPATASELADALLPFASGASAVGAFSSTPDRRARARRLDARNRRSRWRLGLSALLVACASVGVGAFLRF